MVGRYVVIRIADIYRVEAAVLTLCEVEVIVGARAPAHSCWNCIAMARCTFLCVWGSSLVLFSSFVSGSIDLFWIAV